MTNPNKALKISNPKIPKIFTINLSINLLIPLIFPKKLDMKAQGTNLKTNGKEMYVILCVLWIKKLAHAPLSIAQQNTAWPRAADGAILFLRQAGQEKAPTKTIPV